MFTPFLHFVVLYCLKQINGERTIYSIFHLLSGKKSSQTIQDAHLFQLTPFFNTYREISREWFEEIIQSLKKDRLLVNTSSQFYVPTKEGEELILKGQKQFPFLHWLNGYHNQNAINFWRRLSLLVQVSSQLINNETQYVPIQKDKETQNWLKSFLRETSVDRERLGYTLYKELFILFEGSKELDPALIVLRFTGYNTIGLTKKQVCDKLKIEETLYHFQFIALLHFMMKKIEENKQRFPLLSLLLTGLQVNFITQSTNKTYELLKKGYSIEQIGKIRNLKINTIQDHLVELAIQFEDFNISPYVTKNKIEEILQAKNKSTSKQLKHIREYVPEATYFEIRLVLSKYGEDK